MQLFFTFLQLSQLIFLLLLIAYASFLVISLVIGGVHLYEKREHRSRLATHAADVGVSVIVPAYNEALTIVNTIDSLLHLDYDHYEIVVIDDGSSDQTSMVLMNHFPLILHQESINQHIVTKPYKAIYKADVEGVVLTLIAKKMAEKGMH